MRHGSLRGRAVVQYSRKHFRFWMPSGASKFTTLFVFCQLACLAPKVTTPNLTIFSSVSRANWPELHRSQEQSLAKVGWTCSPNKIYRIAYLHSPMQWFSAGVLKFHGHRSGVFNVKLPFVFFFCFTAFLPKIVIGID